MRLPLERQVVGVVGALVDDDGVEVVDRRQERSVARRDAAEEPQKQSMLNRLYLGVKFTHSILLVTN